MPYGVSGSATTGPGPGEATGVIGGAAMVIYVGQGDPEASMRLLWGVPAEGATSARPGPKAGLTLDEIVAAAIALADEGGIDAVSMRAVGQRLGRTSMALYTYVPGKAELIDVMWDRLLGELPTGYDTSRGWRPALARWAHDLWDFSLRHPWTIDISGARAGMGPNETRQQEVQALILADTGLAGRDILRCTWSVARFVLGAARSMAETRQAESQTGVDETQWWLARSRMFDEVAPDYADRFPFLTQLDAAGAFEALSEHESYLEAEARDTFEFGLDRLLDGIESFIASAVAP